MPRLFGFRVVPTTDIKVAIAALPGLDRETRRVAKTVATLVRPLLLHDTGAGARSVKVEKRTFAGSHEYRVSWDKDHSYMTYHRKNRDALRMAAQLVQRSSRTAPD